jgi:hypothetical protein
MQIIQSPEVAAVSPAITDKRGYASRWRLSIRTIDNLIAKGLPHIKIGLRRVRIVICDADAWMQQEFRMQRRKEP